MSQRTTTNPRSIRTIPVDSKLNLATWFDTAQVISILASAWSKTGRSIQACEIGHVRYRPEHRLTICYRIDCRDDDKDRRIDMYVSVLTRGGFRRLREKLEAPEWLAGVETGHIMVLPERSAVLYEFPYDAGLPDLPLVERNDELARVLMPSLVGTAADLLISDDKHLSVEVLRYKPESRLVALCELSWEDPGQECTVSRRMFLRFEKPSRVVATFNKMNKLSLALRDEPTVGIPEALFCFENRGLIGMAAATGDKLSEILRSSEANEGLKRAARVIAKIHRCVLPGVPAGKGVTLQTRVEPTVQLLSAANSDLAAQAKKIGTRLDELAQSTLPGLTGIIHGDFHQGQVLCDNKCNWLIDLDSAGEGETITDLGNFLAQLKRLEWRGRLAVARQGEETFLETYEQEAGVTVDRRRLAYWTGLGLFELAAKDFRRLRPGWPDSVKRILHECTTVLNV